MPKSPYTAAMPTTSHYPAAQPPSAKPAPEPPPIAARYAAPIPAPKPYVPYIPYTTVAPGAASTPRPQPPPVHVRPPLPDRSVQGARAHGTSIAHGMPVVEPGGLADGMAAQRRVVSAAEMRLPAMGSVGTEQSKYYAGQVVDATSGTHYDAASGRPTDSPHARKESEIDIEWDPVTSMATLVARYLCAFAGVVAIACLLAHAYKEYYVFTLIAAMFGAGLLLPIMEVVPKQRDDSDDVWIFVGLTMVFGPTIGLIIYTVIGLLRQSANPAVIGCFVICIVLQIAVYLAASPTLLLFGPPWVQTSSFNVLQLLINWCGVAALAGWASANIFHRFDE